MKKKSVSKKIKFNSKKGLTLVELIVAIMIMMIAVGASVSGLALSYHSIMIGAEKDDAQSVAERNCDIIMNCITSNIDNVGSGGSDLDHIFDDPNVSDPQFQTVFLNSIKADTAINVVGTKYDITAYDAISQQPVGFTPTGSDAIKKQYFTVEGNSRKIGTKDYIVYKITTYAYYTDTAYVTCDGEVNVEK